MGAVGGSTLAWAALALATSPALAIAAERDASGSERGRRSDAEAPERLDLARAGMVIGGVRGTELVGQGSVGRYRGITGAVDLRIERFTDERLGFGLSLGALPPALGDDADGVFVRGEGLVGFGAAAWEGAVPGSLALFVGAGGDYFDIGRTDPARFYGLGRARLSLWLRRDVVLGLAVEAVPLVASEGVVSQHEERFEVTSSYGFFEVGARAAFTFLAGGEPERDLSRQIVSGFVGMVVR